ncbi:MULTISPECIES: SRPBCC family protein [Pasteurellaceae]|uniref:SRPBCC family protein n=1 Tax=Pasteurella atlantica TaxID=2827233 RepID=A0AAW8CKQ8_9PAST|nr:SRPBCC family protein [Pasteurella atlantica]MBR0572618.1 SRPBCC family protein [Pasteurella atlantica]MDP8038564.1 SRPBCC family protein [Pasteurella atlantica]MDP8040656.1 SRPBCC family protein [Pasteurella atlantica]MDP8042791.1 SRPBCC family protein [Pasteurella atlantica]MDP8044878.1 SRPBCC family protein [Pasteurella atlantica]
MFPVIIIFSTIILLLIVIYFVGLLLPKKRVLTKKIIFDVPIEKVYNTVTNNADWKYRTDLDDLKIIDTNGDFQTWEEISNGYTISFKTTKKIPYTFYSFEMNSKLFKGSWSAEFKKIENQKTLFSATENIEYKNPFIKALSYIFMNLDKYMETYQKDLLKKLKQ